MAGESVLSRAGRDAPRPGGDPIDRGPLRGLRPRRPVEIIDATWSLLTSSGGALPVLGWLHVMPLGAALAALVFLPGRAFPIEHPSVPLALLAGFAAGALALRPLVLGAVALGVTDLVHGRGLSVSGCLRRSVERAPGVLGVAGLAFLRDLLTAGYSRLSGSHHILAPLVVVEERSAREARREAARLRATFPGVHEKLNGLYVLLLVAVFVNVWVGPWVLLEVGSVLTGADWAALRAFVLPTNPPYLLLSMVLTVLLLEPARQVSKALLLVDLRLRETGTDLKERLELLRP